MGGAPEVKMASKPNEIQLHPSQRKGFVKMAMEDGSTLVPCFVFGETEIYDRSGLLAQFWTRLTCAIVLALPGFLVRYLTFGLLMKIG